MDCSGGSCRRYRGCINCSSMRMSSASCDENHAGQNDTVGASWRIYRDKREAGGSQPDMVQWGLGSCGRAHYHAESGSVSCPSRRTRYCEKDSVPRASEGYRLPARTSGRAYHHEKDVRDDFAGASSGRRTRILYLSGERGFRAIPLDWRRLQRTCRACG